MNNTSTPSPFKKIPQTGDTLEYSEFNITFLVDEEMNNFLELYNWIKGLTFPKDFDQYKNLKESDQGLLSDMTMTILNSNKNANLNVVFTNAFPISLGDIEFDLTQSDIINATCTASFVYSHYEIDKVSS